MFRLIVDPAASRALGACGLSRESLVRVLTALHADLPNRAAARRPARDPVDPDCFLFPLSLHDAGVRHRLIFRVNDTQAQGFLFVEALTHETESGS
jgi:hypothetical protein